MKKIWSMMLCLALCLGAMNALAEDAPVPQGPGKGALEAAVAGAQKDSGTADAEAEVDEFFRTMVGRISFTVPSLPDLFHEADLEVETIRKMGGGYGGWTHKIQLAGSTDGGAEFIVHIADVAPMMQWMRQEQPGQDEEQYQLNALINLAHFYLAIFNGEFTDGPTPAMARAGDTLLPQMTFSYAYPQEEDGREYCGKAMIDGTQAVILMGEKDAANLAMLNDMRPVPAETAAAFHGRQPQTVLLGRMRVTFPVPPETDNGEGHYFSHVYTPDYAYLNAEHLAIPLEMLLGEEVTDDLLETFLTYAAQGYQDAGVIAEYTVYRVAEGVYAFDGASAKSPRYIENHGPALTLVRGYCTREGVYTLNATDTEMGRAFLDSAVFAEEGK